MCCWAIYVTHLKHLILVLADSVRQKLYPRGHACRAGTKPPRMRLLVPRQLRRLTSSSQPFTLHLLLLQASKHSRNWLPALVVLCHHKQLQWSSEIYSCFSTPRSYSVGLTTRLSDPVNIFEPLPLATEAPSDAAIFLDTVRCIAGWKLPLNENPKALYWLTADWRSLTARLEFKVHRPGQTRLRPLHF